MEAASAMCFHVSPRNLMRWAVRQAQVRADRASTSSSLTVSRPPSAGQDRLGSQVSSSIAALSPEAGRHILPV